MPGDPIDDDADPRSMRFIDERRERFRVSEAARRCEESDRLVSPRTIERVFAYRQQFDVRESHRRCITDQIVGELVIGEIPVALGPFPRTEVHFVDRHRRVPVVRFRTAREPVTVAPVAFRGFAHDRRRCRRMLRCKGKRIGFERKQRAVGAEQLVFINGARAHVGQENLPHPGADLLAHRVTAAVPIVEIANDGNPLRIRCPNRKPDAVDAVHLHRVRAEFLVKPPVRAFSHQVNVDFAEDRTEAIRIFDVARGVADRESQPVRKALAPAGNCTGEKSG